MRLEHLLRYLRALPTVQAHRELDGRMLDNVHSLNVTAQNLCIPDRKLIYVIFHKNRN